MTIVILMSGNVTFVSSLVVSVVKDHRNTYAWGGGHGALVEHLAASPVMHVSRVRALLILLRVFREISLFTNSQCD